MASRSQCSRCAAALPSGANYCAGCGAPQTLMILDPLGVEEPPVIRGADTARHARLRMLAGLGLVVAMLMVLWSLSRQGDPADELPPTSETPEIAADPASSTTDVTTTASTTTAAPTAASERHFVNDVQRQVLGDGVDGALVQIVGRTMRRIDLSTGAIELIDLEHPVYGDGSERGIVVNGNLVSLSGSAITITDLADGSQPEPRDIADGSFAADPALSDDEEGYVVGRANVDSMWLAAYREPDQTSEVIEVDLDGEVKRRVEIRPPFSIDSADGDELILGSPDGSWRYDTATRVTVRIPGAVVAFKPGLVITTSCEESLQCEVRLDRGEGAEVVDWLSASDEFDGPIDVSPDLSRALLHVYTQSGAEFTFVDLHTGSRVDLGHLPMDPYRGVVWIESSGWIIGSDLGSPDALLAINTETATQVDLDLPPSGIGSESFMAFIPAN